MLGTYGRRPGAGTIAARAGLSSPGVRSSYTAGVMFVDDEERIGAVVSVDVADGLVQAIRGITHPDKLEHLGPVLDARELVRRSRR